MRCAIVIALVLLAGRQKVAGAPALLAAPEKALEPPRPTPPIALGFLLLQVTPWARLYIDGRFRADVEGSKRISLSPGVHEVRLVNKRSMAWTVTIESGKTLALTYSFD